jgi:hypothetical protein
MMKKTGQYRENSRSIKNLPSLIQREQLTIAGNQ